MSQNFSLSSIQISELKEESLVRMFMVWVANVPLDFSNFIFFLVGPLSDDQRDKLLKQREQYEVAAEKLEDQLLKLKQNREALKSQGNKHEDNIMKENAKLQVRP